MGAVYERESLEGACVEIVRRNRLHRLSDEIYDKILYYGAEHVPTVSLGALTPSASTSTGSRKGATSPRWSGWMVVFFLQGARSGSYLEGLELLANTPPCPNVMGQYAVQKGALGGRRKSDDFVLPGGRLREQRDLAHDLVTAIPGVSGAQAARRALPVLPAPRPPRATR